MERVSGRGVRRFHGRRQRGVGVEGSFGKGVDGGGCCTVAMDTSVCVCVCAQTVGLQGRSGLDSDFPLRSPFQGENFVWRSREGKRGEREG